MNKEINMKEKKEATFEDKLTRLQEIVRAVEAGTLSIDESMKLYEEGKKLIKELNETLDEASKTIEEVQKD